MSADQKEAVREWRLALIREMLEYAQKGYTPDSEERQILLACLDLNSAYMKRVLG